MLSIPKLLRVEVVGLHVFSVGVGVGVLIAEEQWQLDLQHWGASSPGLWWGPLLTWPAVGSPPGSGAPPLEIHTACMFTASLSTGLHRTSRSSEETWQRPCAVTATLSSAAWT